MKFELGQVNLQLCFIDVSENIMAKVNCNDILNKKNTIYEETIAYGLLCEIINNVRHCLKEKVEPVKTVYYLTHKPTLDRIIKKVQDSKLTEYISVERAPVNGFTLSEIKSIAKSHQNVVFVNLNCIFEYVRDCHYNDKARQIRKLCKDVKKDLSKIAKNTNSCLTFGYILPQAGWSEKDIEETKEYYCLCREFPYNNVSIGFCEQYRDGSQTFKNFNYIDGVFVDKAKYEINVKDVQEKTNIEAKKVEKPKEGLFRFVTGWKKPN